MEKKLLLVLSFLITPLAITASDNDSYKEPKAAPTSAASAAEADDDWDKDGDQSGWGDSDEHDSDCDDAAPKIIDHLAILTREIEKSKPNETTLRELLDAHPELINEPGKRGDTPLHIACKAGNPIAVKLLCPRGANIHQKNNLGQTPQDCAELVKDKRAKKEIKTIFDKTMDEHAFTACDAMRAAGCTENEVALALGAEQRFVNGTARQDDKPFPSDTERKERIAERAAKADAEGDAKTANECLQVLWPTPLEPSTTISKDPLAEPDPTRRLLGLFAVSIYVTPENIEASLRQGADIFAEDEQGKTVFDKAVKMTPHTIREAEYIVQVTLKVAETMVQNISTRQEHIRTCLPSLLPPLRNIVVAYLGNPTYQAKIVEIMSRPEPLPHRQFIASIPETLPYLAKCFIKSESSEE